MSGEGRRALDSMTSLFQRACAVAETTANTTQSAKSSE